MNIPAISDDFRFVLWIYTAISSAISVVLLAYTGNYLNFLIRHKVKGERPGGRAPGKPGIITWIWLLISLIGAGVCTAIASSAPESIGNDRTVLPIFINSIALILAGFLAISLKINRQASCALLGLFVVSGAIVGIKSYKEYQRIQQKTVILVMTIDGPDEEYRFTEILFGGLHAEFDNYEDVLVLYSDQTISEQQGSQYARDFGKKQLADAVFWGWYSATDTDALIKIHVENLNEELLEELSVGTDYATKTSVASLDSFELQLNSSEALTGSILFLSGYTHYLTYDFENAVIRFEKALSSPSWADEIINKNSAMFYLATTQFALGDYQNALIWYGEVTKNDPSFAMAFINRSMINYSLGKYEEALADSNKAIQLIVQDEKNTNPKYYNKFIVYINRGSIYGDMDQSNLAIADYTTAINLAPDHPTAYYNRGVEYLFLGDYQSAINDFNTAIEKDKNYLDAYHNIGAIYANTGNPSGAIENYTIVIRGKEKMINSDLSQRGEKYVLQVQMDLARVYKDRAISYAQLKEFKKAIKDCRKSIYYGKDFADGYATLGVVYLDMGYYSLAIDELNMAIKINDKNALYYFNRGAGHFMIGNYPLAKNDFINTLELTDDPYIISNVENYLQELNGK